MLSLTMSKHSVSIMNLILYEIPLLLHQVAIKILAGKSDFSCQTWNGGNLMVKVFFEKFIHCFYKLYCLLRLRWNSNHFAVSRRGTLHLRFVHRRTYAKVLNELSTGAEQHILRLLGSRMNNLTTTANQLSKSYLTSVSFLNNDRER